MAPLAALTFETVIEQLLEAAIWTLPAALPSEDTYQLSITVLNHQLLIRSRSLNNQQVEQKTGESIVFTKLADSLLSLNPQVQAKQSE